MWESPPILAEAGALLRKPPSKEVALELSDIRFPLAEEKVKMLRLVYEKRKQMLWPKDAEKGLTELDRTTRLNGDLAPLEADYEFIKTIELLIEQRLELIKLLTS